MSIGFKALKETLNSVLKASKTVCWRYQALATRRVFQFLISRNFSTSGIKYYESRGGSSDFRLPTSDFCLRTFTSPNVINHSHIKRLNSKPTFGRHSECHDTSTKGVVNRIPPKKLSKLDIFLKCTLFTGA